MQELCYSTKIPMTIIRSKAGMVHGKGLNFNPRTQCIPPDELRNQVFPWLRAYRDPFMKLPDKVRNGNPTALKFLEFLDKLQTVFFTRLCSNAYFISNTNET